MESFWDPTTKDLYENRLKQKNYKNCIDESEDINISWKKLKKIIKEAAANALAN